MKGTNKTLLLVAGTVGGILLYDYITKKLDTVNGLSAIVKNVQFGKLEFPNLELLVSVQVTNQSPNDAVASSFAGDLVDANGTIIGKFNVLFNQNQKIVVPANGNAIIDVNVNANILSAATTLAQGQQIKVDGKVVIDNIPVPVITDVAIGCACSNN